MKEDNPTASIIVSLIGLVAIYGLIIPLDKSEWSIVLISFAYLICVVSTLMTFVYIWHVLKSNRSSK
jgi:hypothetical protein